MKRNPLNPLNTYIEAANRAENKFWDDIKKLGETIREEVIVPACKKHGLTFISGMGRFFFVYKNSRGQSCDFEDELDFGSLSVYMKITERKLEDMKEDLIPILKMLNHEVSHHQYLGFFVSDVKKEDYT